ncbi:MAG: beta-ketoacyl synthase chain length factor [Prevotellaceae bacterium]|jgi:3-oxoacyl-(acyl-carrier-protein) synthase|nr:beta-ketoacyl synthase chain length factor [Prevotellaceae bacterium]
MNLPMTKKIYIQAATQISLQQPLCETWMDTPAGYDVPYARSIDPDFKAFLTPLEARRMGKLLKRALTVSLHTLRTAGIAQPDAIITGTGLGCIESTEQFLHILCEEGEELLKPTCFMQSTHNTISSLIAIHTGTHGYNMTYSHKGISFDCALLDARMLLRAGRIRHALVGGHDELTPSYFTLLQRIGYVGVPGMTVAGEVSVAMLLTTESPAALCELAGIRMLYKPSPAQLQTALDTLLDEAAVPPAAIDAVMTGDNGNPANDEPYRVALDRLLPDTPRLHYKHLFGECYTASGMGIYAAAHYLQRGAVAPDALNPATGKLRTILCFHQFEGKNYSLVLLKAICGE